MFGIDTLLNVGMKLVDKFFPDPAQKQEFQLKLLEMQQNGELKQLEAQVAQDQETTKRWQADMSSDSKLSKNIRPATLIYILTAYLLFAVMSAYGVNINEAYVKLLGEWGQLIMLAYFGGRTVEKGMELYSKKGEK